MAETGKTVNRAGRAVDSVEKLVEDNEAGIVAAVKDFSKAVEKANDFFEKGASLVSETNDSVSRLKSHLLVVGENLARASASLNQLIDLISDQPSKLLLGSPPAPRKVEP